MTATIKDVAQKAQVGVGTVSRVLNHSPAVSQSTRLKVEQAIQELNYSPNPSARRLSTGKTWQIAIVLPYLTLPSYVERLRGVQAALAGTEYKPILYSVGRPQQQQEYLSRLSHKNHVDGCLVLSLTPTPAQTEKFIRNDIPIVLIDASHERLSHVYVDDVRGGRMATRHLLDLGHEKIAYLTDYLQNPFHRSAAAHRYQGYRQALQDACLPCREEYFIQGEPGRQSAKRMAIALLSTPDPPSAIFTSCDTQAVGVLDAAQELGLSVPEDLSLIGFDGIETAEFINLTTISQPLYKSGQIGAKMLLHSLSSSSSPYRKHQLTLQLTKRGTTAPPRRHQP